MHDADALQPDASPTLIPAVLHCPRCAARHVDAPPFDTTPHHTHLCEGCGFTWRVEPYCVGVAGPEHDEALAFLARLDEELRGPCHRGRFDAETGLRAARKWFRDLFRVAPSAPPRSPAAVVQSDA